jgi:hypothetical protein
LRWQLKNVVIVIRHATAAANAKKKEKEMENGTLHFSAEEAADGLISS